MPHKSERALVILAAFDFESLQLTLQSLEHTIDRDETVVVILNSKGTLPAARVERVARAWAAKNHQYRHVVRPINAGSPPFDAFTETFKNFEPFKKVKYICKIDDDLIAIRKGWLDRLATVYEDLSKSKKIGFVTGLINNNNWGFKQLVEVFGKKDEYGRIMNYDYISGNKNEKRIPAGEIDDNIAGTMWQSPYAAWWVHQWTSNNLHEYVSKTESLGLKQIPFDVHYSIGCIYFERDYWLSLDWKFYHTRFDEGIVHLNTRDNQLEKWAVMSEPMIHLFYSNQRIVNHDLVESFTKSLADFYQDPAFTQIERIKTIDYAMVNDEMMKEIQNYTKYVHRKIAGLSFSKKWDIKTKFRKLFNKY